MSVSFCLPNSVAVSVLSFVVVCGLVLGCCVIVVLLPRPMEGNGVTPIFRSLQNCQFHHRRVESLEHFNVLYIYIYIILHTTLAKLNNSASRATSHQHR